MIATPAHGSLPSGHATEAFITSLVLYRLLASAPPPPPPPPPPLPHPHPVYSTPAACEQLLRLASRVAINRTVAGVHFPVDSIAGCMLGLTLGEYFVARCTGALNYTPWTFDGTVFTATDDFNWRALFDTNVPAPVQASTVPYVTAGPAENFTAALHSPLLAYLWNSARREWL